MLLFVVLMHIECIVLRDLNYTAADVGTVVGNTLEVGKYVGKNEAVLDGALALLESDDVIELDLIAKIVNYLLERLDLGCGIKVVVDKGYVSELEYLLNRTAKYGKLSCRLVGECELLGSDLLAGLYDVDRVVGDTLIVTDDVKELGNLLGIALVGGICRNLDEVRADSVLEVVHLAL